MANTLISKPPKRLGNNPAAIEAWRDRVREKRRMYYRHTRDNKRRLPAEVRRKYFMFKNAQKRARARGVEFMLTLDWISTRLDVGVCEVTGIPFGESKGPWAPSIDRKDSTGGYTPENCQMVVMIHNYARHTWGDEALCQYVAKLVARVRP